MSRTLYSNAEIFTSDARPRAEALVVDGDRILYVGDAVTATRLAGDSAAVVDLEGATVLPGFVDGHAHVVGTGEAAQQADLWGADSLTEIQHRIRAWADANPTAPRIRAQGWAHGALHGMRPHRSMLDAIGLDRPIYVQAYDYHSIWVDTRALEELNIDARTAAPAGGRIHADASGPTGLIDETAMHRLVWPYLDRVGTDDDLVGALRGALAAYGQSGITTATEMALDSGDLGALAEAERSGSLTTRIVAYWRVQPTGSEAGDLEQVKRARALADQHSSEYLRVTGIKVLIDGTVDGCTAALGLPYADGTTADPIWTLEALAPVMIAADAAGLQVAMHAIGDEAVRIALAAVEATIRENGPADRRHRIEHLEVVGREEIDRLAALGVIASMQPVHADPAIQENWRAMLGDGRVERGFPWSEVSDAGARLVFGTDSPTAPHSPLPNMFVASTRRSALIAGLSANLPEFAVPLEDAIRHGTADAAWACRAEHNVGRLAAGMLADFIVLDAAVNPGEPEQLLRTRVERTVLGGRTVYQREDEDAGPAAR